MTYALDLCSSFLKNVRPLDFLKEDAFIVYVNDIKVSLPLAIAAGLSTNVSKLLHKDSTAREYDVKVDFHNKSNTETIANILKSSASTVEVTLGSDNDIVDFAEFGIAFGNSEFVKPLETIAEKRMKEGLSVENTLEVIKYKDALSHVEGRKIDFTEEVKFIAQHFSSGFYCVAE